MSNGEKPIMFHFNSIKKNINFIFLILALNILFLSNLSSFGSAWDNGNDINDPLIIPVGEMPVIDGIKDDSWDDANSSSQIMGDIPIKLFIMRSSNSSSNYILILVEIEVANHDDNEYLRLLLSNSTESDEDDFYDAKLIQNRNFDSENKSYILNDQHLSGEEFLNDDLSNFNGASNISEIGHSFYEFRINYSSDNENDTEIEARESYAIKIQWGNSESGNIDNENPSETLYIQVGVKTSDGDDEITELILDMDIISNITFIVVISAFAIIFMMVYRNKTY